MNKLLQARAATFGLALTATLILPLLGACAAHSHPAPHAHHHRRTAAVRVVVANGHLHTAGCGHYRHRGHWYHVRGHAHGARCGHVFTGGVWVLRR